MNKTAGMYLTILLAVPTILAAAFASWFTITGYADTGDARIELYCMKVDQKFQQYKLNEEIKDTRREYREEERYYEKRRDERSYERLIQIQQELDDLIKQKEQFNKKPQ